MKLEEIFNGNDLDYCGKLIYRTEWNKYQPHMALRLRLTNAELVYVPDNKDGNIETFENEYKFSMYEVMVNDWEYYE